jgi:hypothetical protein
MKSVNVYRAIPSSRFALRLAFFSFLCLMLFALSSPRLNIAPAVSAAASQRMAQQQQKRTQVKSDAIGAKTGVRPSGKSADKAPASISDDEVDQLTVCTQNQPINFGETKNGSLDNDDCVSPVIRAGQTQPNGSRVDEYTFNGTAGQKIAISLTASYDTYLYLLRPDGSVLFENDDIDGEGNPANLNSRIPPSGFYILPFTGTYSILANSFAPESRGAYSLTLSEGGVCARTPIAYGESKAGTLASGDCLNVVDPADFDNSLVDLYTFSGTAGQQISVTMTATTPGTVNPYLYLLLPDGEVIAKDDDSGGGTTARIPPLGEFGRLPVTGTYIIVANTLGEDQAGNYNLTLTQGPNCVSTPLAPGNTVNGALANGDCRLLEDGSLLDAYTFNGTAGQQVNITMTSNSGGFFPALFLLAPDGNAVRIEPNNNASNTVRLPATNSVNLPTTGAYTILANSVAAGQAGNYSLNLTSPSCSTTLATASQSVGDAAAEFNVGVTAQGCGVTATSNASWITVTSTNNGAGPVTYTVQQNTTGASRTGTISINNQTFTVTQSAPCTFTLGATSQNAPSGGGSFSVGVTTPAGCTVTATSNAPWITVTSTNGGAGPVSYTVQQNTAGTSRTGTISINGQTFTVTQAALVCTYSLPSAGQTVSSGGGNFFFTVNTQTACQLPTPSSDSSWLIVNSFSTDGNGVGRVDFTAQPNSQAAPRTGKITVGSLVYTVTQNSAVIPPPAIQFQSANFTVNESDASKAVTITVERTGDTTGTSTVEYATVDNAEPVPCDPTIKKPDGTNYPQGTAYARCDYATSVDTLTFGVGEIAKTFTISLINDVHVEGNETFQISLSSPQGATLGTQSNATVTILIDDTAPPSGNPINQTPFFVRMQYLDFLSREPEPNEPWSPILNNCPNRFNPAGNFADQSAGCDRIIVSQSFFGSPEFRLKGFFVFLYYKASFGSPGNPNYYPQYDQFAPDIRRVSGQTAEEVFAKRLAFSQNWLTRPAFKEAFGSIEPLTPANNAAFVDRLLANLNITLTVADPTSGVTRNSLVSDLDNGRKTRAEVLRFIVESTEASNAQFNFAFVAIQYFGYLRRTPDPSGYQAWLNVLNNSTIDPRARPRLMIDGFMNSTEYRIRFGPNTIQP